jgi:Lrp/AsnC family leucine-responsive transcriptional regulator
MEFKLDAKDKKILEQLEVNSRQSNRQISKKVGLSKDAVGYRVNRLEKEGLISSYYSVINIAKIGLMQFKLLIAFQNINSEIESEIINYLKKDKNVGWITGCDGYYNLMIVVWAKTPIEFNNFLTFFLNKYSKYCKLRDIVIIPDEYSFRNSYLYSKSHKLQGDYYGGEPKLELDKKGITITKLLANNSRISLHEIASKIGLTSEAVAHRIKKLQENKTLLAFRPKLNTSLLGYSFYNILFKLKRTNNLEKMYNYLKANPNVIYLSKYLGTYDLGIDLEIKNQDELRNILSVFRDQFKEDIESYISVLVYKEHKLNYFPF